MSGDNLIGYVGSNRQRPMLLADQDDTIIWHNDWATWLFSNPDLENTNLRQLEQGDVLAEYAARVRSYQCPDAIRLGINTVCLEITATLETYGVLFRFHPILLTRPGMLDAHNLMQDFARETGDRVNNPLTTVLNCLHLLQQEITTDPARHYLELAIREGYAMKDFGDWVRRLSEEPPALGNFDLVETLRYLLERRGGIWRLEVFSDVPLVRGNEDNAKQVLGGLINLIRQAGGRVPYVIQVDRWADGTVVVEMGSEAPRVKDIRMLSEEFYGGLGLMAARYLLSLMQAHLELDYKSGVGIRVSFLPGEI